MFTVEAAHSVSVFVFKKVCIFFLFIKTCFRANFDFLDKSSNLLFYKVFYHRFGGDKFDYQGEIPAIGGEIPAKQGEIPAIQRGRDSGCHTLLLLILSTGCQHITHRLTHR